MNRQQIEELKSRYASGEPLSVQEEDHLLQWLGDCPEERQDFLIDEEINNQLQCLVRLENDELSESFISKTVGRLEALNDDVATVDVIPSRKQAAPRVPRWNVTPARFCAAALFFCCVGMLLFESLRQKPHDFGFASIANASNMSWDLVDEQNRRVRVTSGSGEILFDNGTIAQLSAPAILELRDPSHLFVKTGAVKVNVPPQAIGFTVETPIARIVDFGTTFDVNVAESGKTETRVQSGVVTFQTHSMSLAQSDPIKLTADGLNHASAQYSDFTDDVRSVRTEVSGNDGQFYGTIHADGDTVEFRDRHEFDEFLNRIRTSVEQNPSAFREQWNVIVQSTENGMSTTVESISQSGSWSGSGNSRARDMLLQQLRSMQERHHGNVQMQELIEDMIRQVGEDPEKTSH